MIGGPGSDGAYFLACDVCGETADAIFREFNEAVSFKRNNGWKSQRYNGEWEDVCPDCSEEEQ